VVGGLTYSSSVTERDFALARYKMDGTLDTAFDVDGKVRKALSYSWDEITAMRVDSSGRIVTAGRRFWNANWHFALVRFERDGYFDSAFGNQGKVYTLFYSGGNQIDAEASALALAPDGKIVVAGYSASGSIFGETPILLARYEP
ncbi:MAG TPA: hypothetical protein VL572_05150, partial [Pyrinomonadaceae bacterium]|nr:hypothetical protein [Pyrinomonadaceae bacterium]